MTQKRNWFAEKLIYDFYGQDNVIGFFDHPWHGTAMVKVKEGRKEKNYEVVVLAKNIHKYKKEVAKRDARIRAKMEHV